VKEWSTLRLLLTSKPPPTAVESDTNGPLVGGEHRTLNGGQANDHSSGTTNDQFVAVANGHTEGRSHASVTDSPYSVFSKTLSKPDPNSASRSHENIHSAEVQTLSFLFTLGLVYLLFLKLFYHVIRPLAAIISISVSVRHN